jgi:hypothetical protein
MLDTDKWHDVGPKWRPLIQDLVRHALKKPCLTMSGVAVSTRHSKALVSDFKWDLIRVNWQWELKSQHKQVNERSPGLWMTAIPSPSPTIHLFRNSTIFLSFKFSRHVFMKSWNPWRVKKYKSEKVRKIQFRCEKWREVCLQADQQTKNKHNKQGKATKQQLPEEDCLRLWTKDGL